MMIIMHLRWQICYRAWQYVTLILVVPAIILMEVWEHECMWNYIEHDASTAAFAELDWHWY